VLEAGSRSSMTTLLKHPLKFRRKMYLPDLDTRGLALLWSYGKIMEARSWEKLLKTDLISYNRGEIYLAMTFPGTSSPCTEAGDNGAVRGNILYQVDVL
jgi:hypothetical protein